MGYFLEIDFELTVGGPHGCLGLSPAHPATLHFPFRSSNMTYGTQQKT